MASVVSVTSGKGGAGKSSVSVGLSVALAKRGKRVLIIDSDSGLRCLDHLLGVTEQLVFDISDVIFGFCSPLKAIYPCPYCQGLYLLPAPIKNDHVVSSDAMQKIVQTVGKYFDIIIIDSPAGLGRGFHSAISPADFVFVVTNADPISIRDSIRVRENLNEMKKDKRRLIINKFDVDNFQKQGQYKSVDQLIDETTLQLLGIVPFDNKIVLSSIQGDMLDKNSKAAAAFSRIAARMEGEHVPVVI